MPLIPDNDDDRFPKELLCPFCGKQIAYGGEGDEEGAWWFGEACPHLLWAGGSWLDDFDHMSEDFRKLYVAKCREESGEDEEDADVCYDINAAIEATPRSAKIVSFTEYGMACGPVGVSWSAAFLDSTERRGSKKKDCRKTAARKTSRRKS
jgi:hypothetical protein